MDSILPPLLIALVLIVQAVVLRRWLTRRAAFRDFARERGLRFRGMIPGDKYPPYALFWLVSGTPLVYHVVEGHLNGFDVAVFDLPGKSGTRTGAIVSGLPVAETPAPPSEGDLRFELQDGHLLGSRSRVPIEDLSSFLESVVSVARRSS